MTESVLTERQIRVLKIIGEHDWLRSNFYLTGGTALAGFYLHHRYSEDLDFFSEKEIDAMQIQVFFREKKASLGYSTIDFQQSFNRNLFFLKYDDEVLKMEFAYFPFPRIEKGGTEYGISIDSALDIAVNKLFTIHQLARARDYIDLYFLCKEHAFTIADLAGKARVKFDWHIDPLQLGAQFLKAKDAVDEPRMIKEVSADVWQQFFLEEARKLKSEIIG